MPPPRDVLYLVPIWAPPMLPSASQCAVKLCNSLSQDVVTAHPKHLGCSPERITCKINTGSAKIPFLGPVKLKFQGKH